MHPTNADFAIDVILGGNSFSLSEVIFDSVRRLSDRLVKLAARPDPMFLHVVHKSLRHEYAIRVPAKSRPTMREAGTAGGKWMWAAVAELPFLTSALSDTVTEPSDS